MMSVKKVKEKYIRKQVDFFRLVQKIKLWPSRSGTLHGIKSVELIGAKAVITTHCQCTFAIRHSKRSRAARWLRNKWFFAKCKTCKIPDWKLEKYSKTFFRQHRGALLGIDKDT